VVDDRFDPDLLDEQDPFEIEAQAAHLFKHPYLGLEDVDDVLARPRLSWRDAWARPNRRSRTLNPGVTRRLSRRTEWLNLRQDSCAHAPMQRRS